MLDSRVNVIYRPLSCLKARVKKPTVQSTSSTKISNYWIPSG